MKSAIEPMCELIVKIMNEHGCMVKKKAGL